MTDGFGVLCSELRRRENFRGHVNDRVKHMICMNGETGVMFYRKQDCEASRQLVRKHK